MGLRSGEGGYKKNHEKKSGGLGGGLGTWTEGWLQYKRAAPTRLGPLLASER